MARVETLTAITIFLNLPVYGWELTGSCLLY
jgi:hypothetical protein